MAMNKYPYPIAKSVQSAGLNALGSISGGMQSAPNPRQWNPSAAGAMIGGRNLMTDPASIAQQDAIRRQAASASNQPMNVLQTKAYGNNIDPGLHPTPVIPAGPLPQDPGTTGTSHQPSQFQAPPTVSIPTWEETYKAYDASSDPLIGQAAQAGQQQLSAGLSALNQLFGEQRNEIQGRAFNQGLSGSGIQEAIYGKQYREEGRQAEQLTSEVGAQTAMNQLDIMREGTDRAITLAQNEIDTAFKTGQLSLDQYNAYTNNLQAETDRLRAEEDQKRTAIMDAQAFAPEGGEDYARRMEGTNPWLYNSGDATGFSTGNSGGGVRGSAENGYTAEEAGFGQFTPFSEALGGGLQHGTVRKNPSTGESFKYDAYTQRWYPA